MPCKPGPYPHRIHSFIRIIKYNLTNSILRKLPLLPDSVETKLFLEGRDAWRFKLHLLNEISPISPDEKISLEVIAILKKEFHEYQDKTHYELPRLKK